MMACVVLSMCALTADATAAAAPPATELELADDRFGSVRVYRPATPPRGVVLFVSGDGGWSLGVVDMARALVGRGAVVAGIDVRGYLQRLPSSGRECESLAVDFEALAHLVEKHLGLDHYLVPMLVGYSSGAAIVYAALAQSPPGTFAGAISLGFCPDQDFHGANLCRESALTYIAGRQGTLILEPARRLSDPWIALQGQQDQVCSAQAVDAFAAAISNAEVVRLPAVGHGFSVARNWQPQLLTAYQRLADHGVPPVVEHEAVADLPLVEVLPPGAPAPTPEDAPAAPLVVMLSGDGGWAGLDRGVSSVLAANGMPVVGFSSLRYFWKAREPEEAARDLARVLSHYMRQWSRERVLLIGYSLGADVLPFLINRLPPALRQHVAGTALIGLSRTAVFEIHVSGWLPGGGRAGVPVAPEAARLEPDRVLCLYGSSETDTLCPELARTGIRAVELGGGHHLGGDYEDVARRILEWLAVINVPHDAVH